MTTPRGKGSRRRSRNATARRPGGPRTTGGVDPREQLAQVLERLVDGELGARQAQKQAYAIRSKAVIDLPEPLWRLLDSMAAEEQRGHRSVVFEGRVQQLTMATGQLRTQVARGQTPPARPPSRRWGAWRSWVIGGAAIAWWVAVALMSEGRYIGLTDDE